MSGCFLDEGALQQSYSRPVPHSQTVWVALWMCDLKELIDKETEGG